MASGSGSRRRSGNTAAFLRFSVSADMTHQELRYPSRQRSPTAASSSGTPTPFSISPRDLPGSSASTRIRSERKRAGSSLHSGKWQRGLRDEKEDAGIGIAVSCAEYAAWIWTNVEEWDTNLAKQYNDTDVTDRSKIEATAKECVQKALNEKYGNQIVNVVSVTIGNINFSDAYNAAIEKKAQAKLAAEAEEYENLKATQKAEAAAEQARITAEGEADAKRIRAEGDAEAMKIAADAEAEANKKIAGSLTPELIQLEKINKWDGKLPSIQGATTPVIDVSDLITE